MQLPRATPSEAQPASLKSTVLVDESVSLIHAPMGSDGAQSTCDVITGQFRVTKAGELCPECGKRHSSMPDMKVPALTNCTGVEVGHTFLLGRKYSEVLNARFTDEHNKTVVSEMGCFGLGVTRILSTIIETSHDKYDHYAVCPSRPWLLQGRNCLAHGNCPVSRLHCGVERAVEEKSRCIFSCGVLVMLTAKNRVQCSPCGARRGTV